jgi:hypothetical protein
MKKRLANHFTNCPQIVAPYSLPSFYLYWNDNLMRCLRLSGSGFSSILQIPDQAPASVRAAALLALEP